MQRSALSLALLALLVLGGCHKESAEPTPAAEATPVAPAEPAPVVEPAPAAAAAPTASAKFDPNSVPESTTALPPFPFFQTPEGLEGLLAGAERNSKFDREHMIAGEAVTAVEGKVFRDQFQLARSDARQYSEIEFQRNYSDAIRTLGGVEVSRVQYTDAVNTAFGGRDAVDKHYHGTCASDGCENHSYLIRQGGKEYWIQVSTGAIPLHGYVVVLEREGMKSALGFLDAGAMKQAIDATGKVALQINFDTDKATLRPDALPTVDEIAKLLQNDATLTLSIDGHTDNTGTAARNKELSQQRAEAVRAALVGKGIAAERLSAQGFGQDKPVADNGSDAGRAQNRRVELVKRT